MSICVKIPGGFLTLAATEFACPGCGKKYDDVDGKYSKRCNKNKKGYTTIECSCEKKFGVAYNYKGDVQSFNLE